MNDDPDSTGKRALKSLGVTRDNGKTDFGRAIIMVAMILGGAGGGSGLLIAQNTRDKVLINETKIELNRETVDNAISEAKSDRENLKKDVKEVNQGVQQILRKLEAQEAVEKERRRKEWTNRNGGRDQ